MGKITGFLEFEIARHGKEYLNQLQEREAELPSLPAEPLRIARNLVFGVRGLGATATSAEDMRDMTRLAVDMLCAAVERLHAA